MRTNYHDDMIEYYKNWKTGMGPYWGPNTEKKKIKYTKKTNKRKMYLEYIMEKIQLELGLTEEELDDLLIPEEEWNDL